MMKSRFAPLGAIALSLGCPPTPESTDAAVVVPDVHYELPDARVVLPDVQVVLPDTNVTLPDAAPTTEDAPSRPDTGGGTVTWTNCADAVVFGSMGEACAFAGSCVECTRVSPPRQGVCVGGTLRLAAAPPDACSVAGDAGHDAWTAPPPDAWTASPDARTCAAGPETSVAACSDGCSNDGDSFIDCDDFDCCALVSCAPTTACGRRDGGGGDAGPRGDAGMCGPRLWPPPAGVVCSAVTRDCLIAATTQAAFDACVAAAGAPCVECMDNDIGSCATDNGCDDELGALDCCATAACPPGSPTTCVSTALMGTCSAQTTAWRSCVNATIMSETCGLTLTCFPPL